MPVSEPRARQLKKSWLYFSRGRVVTLWNRRPPKVLVTAEEGVESQMCDSAHKKWSIGGQLIQTSSDWRQSKLWVRSRKEVYINLFVATYSKCPPAEVNWQWKMLCSSWCFMLTTEVGQAINQMDRKSTGTIWYSNHVKKLKERHIVFYSHFHSFWRCQPSQTSETQFNNTAIMSGASLIFPASLQSHICWHFNLIFFMGFCKS